MNHDTAAPGRSLLMPILEYAEFIELRRFALEARERGGWEAVFFFPRYTYRRLAEDTAQLVGDGFRWVDHTGTVHHRPREEAATNDGAAGTVTPRQQTRNARRRGPVKALAVDLINLTGDIRRYRRLLREYNDLIERLRPDCVVAAQDFAGSEISILFSTARNKGIPRLIVPFAMFNIEEARNFAMARPAHHVNGSPLNRLLPLLRSGRWVLSHAGKRLCRLPASRALALEALGLAPEKPWVPCDGAANVICVGSDAARSSMTAMGLRADRIAATGALVHDHLHRIRHERDARRTALLGRTGQNDADCLVLCAWPPTQTVHRSADQEFANFAELGTAWAGALTRLRDRGCAVVVKAHPKAVPDELEAARAAGLAIVEDDTADLLPLCDVFATTASSVTAWAIALGIPVVDYDCYGFGYADFAADEGVLKPHTAAEFSELLDRLVFDDPFRKKILAFQQQRARHWGGIDGMASARLTALLESLMKKQTLQCG